MRLISIAILVVSGAFMVAAAALCDAINRNASIDGFAAFCGTLLLLGGSFMFVIEWYSGLPKKARAEYWNSPPGNAPSA